MNDDVVLDNNTKPILSSTGDFDESKHFKYIRTYFDDYEIRVKLTQNDKFIGIEEIRVKKNFITPNTIKAQCSLRNIEKYFVDDED